MSRYLDGIDLLRSGVGAPSNPFTRSLTQAGNVERALSNPSIRPLTLGGNIIMRVTLTVFRDVDGMTRFPHESGHYQIPLLDH